MSEDGDGSPSAIGSLWRPIACIVISIIGIGVSIYLTYVHYSPNGLVCPGNNSGIIDCAKVLTSAQSVLFKIPIPFYGMAFFVAMIVLNLPVMWRSTSKWIAWARLAAVVIGMCMVLYLVSQELVVIRSICIWCTSVHLLTFIMFIIVITGWEQTGWARSQREADED